MLLRKKSVKLLKNPVEQGGVRVFGLTKFKTGWWILTKKW